VAIFNKVVRQSWRHAVLVGIGLAATVACCGQASGKEAGGELVVMDWMSGSDRALIRELEAGFTAAHPSVKIREISLTAQGDARGAVRTALMGGEKADLLLNAWPAFRAELADANMLRPLDHAWEANKWSDNLADGWRRLGQTKGVTYGVTYTYGDRSGIFYRKDVLKKAGIATPPATWADFLASFKKLNAVGITPVAMPAKVWAHADWFESLLLRTAGVDAASQLAAHKIRWTDPVVKTALQKFAEMLKANCCGNVNRMLATDWDNAADEVLKAGTHGYDLIGMWVNSRAQTDYGLKEGKDYGLFQFPALGLGHDDTTSVDTKEFLELSSGGNQPAAEAFLGWLSGPEAVAILAKHGAASPSKKANPAMYGPVVAASVSAVSSSKTQFVLGDLLPGDLVDEYRVQMQRFLQDPSDANIAKVQAAIEAKAAVSYK
jgi:ABC-type glycerol-3-phosphate transport system substrate-binding protein